MAITRLGRGVRMYRAVTAAAGSVDWEEVQGLTGAVELPFGTASKVDISTHVSVATTGRRSYRAGVQETKDFSAPFNVDLMDPVHQRVISDSETAVERDYKITFGDGVTVVWLICGSVGDISVSLDMIDKATGTLALYVNSINTNYLGA